MRNTEVEKYIDNIEEKWKKSYLEILGVLENKVPKGFELILEYKMPTFVIPLSTYPPGYRIGHVPLPFISLAAQKQYISLYHLGLYADQAKLKWFTEEYERRKGKKLNMGKSCIRFGKEKDIDLELIGQLAEKFTPEEWISIYEGSLK